VKVRRCVALLKAVQKRRPKPCCMQSAVQNVAVDNIAVAFPPTPAPPQPEAAARRVNVRGSTVNVGKVLAGGQCALGITVSVMAIFQLIGIFVTFNAVNFFVALILIPVGLLLAGAAFLASSWLTAYFGFLRVMGGAGAALVLTGALSFGVLGLTGAVIGSITMGWGLVGIVLHVVFRPAVGTAVLWDRG